MLDLSLSSVINDCSAAMFSPCSTSTSIISTLSYSPISGTRISIDCAMFFSALARYRVRFVLVKAVLLYCFGNHLRFDFALFFERVKGSDNNIASVDFKKVS